MSLVLKSNNYSGSPGTESPILDGGSGRHRLEDCDILEAARRGNVELLRKIIRFGRSLETVESETGKTALHVSVENRNLECCLLLLKNGPNVHVRDHFGRHALFYAVEKNHLRMAKRLVLHGLNCNAQDNNGVTCVMVAVHNGLAEMLSMLLEIGGANPNYLNTEQQSALHIVCIKPFQDSVQLARTLIKHGADVNQRSANQWTCLHYCVKYGKLNLALFLLDNGANPLLADDLKEAPLDLMNDNRNDLFRNSNDYNLLLRKLAYVKSK